MNARPRLIFAHANGFTPGAYEPLLSQLRERYSVEAPALLPLRNGIAPSGSWAEIARDLATQVDAIGTPTVGVGHSLGAVALLMVAAMRPARFSKLVLIEPPTVPTWGAALLRFAPNSVRRHSPMAMAARRRTDSWASFEEAYSEARGRHWFARIPDDALRGMLRHGLQREHGGTWRPRFPKEWEARLYESPTSVWPLLRQALPAITVMRGDESKVFGPKDLARWRRMRPNDEIVEVRQAGHLLPLEQPHRVVWS